jgi:hypothetical protein
MAKFNPTDGGKVLKSDADKWIKKFDDERRDKLKDTKSVFYGKDILQELINTPECAGVSFFFAKKFSEELGKDVMNLVLIPTKADGTLIYPTSSDGKDVSLQYVWDTGKTCPPTCPE